MKYPVSFWVNGTYYELLIDPRRTLAEVLREELHLTGTKEVCGDGNCGACTVIVDNKAALSCLKLAVQVDGAKILTVEGLASAEGKLHPLQRSFIDAHAVQCGFCTPGMIMSAKALLDENPNPTEQEVIEAIGGNLCRCTGYKKIVKAIMDVRES